MRLPNPPLVRPRGRPRQTPAKVAQAPEIAHLPTTASAAQTTVFEATGVAADVARPDVHADVRATLLPTVNGMRALLTQDVQLYYPMLTPDVLKRIDRSELARIELNEKNKSYMIEDLESYLALNRNAGSAPSARSL